MYIKFKSENESALMVSMKVSYHIAHGGEAHSIRKKFIKPCTTDLAACMKGEKVVRKIMLLSSSDYKVQRRIQDCTVIVLDELLQRPRLNESFTIQLGNLVNLAIMLVLAGMFKR
jgi:hypothetical protein